jgi:hypothetical protein
MKPIFTSSFSGLSDPAAQAWGTALMSAAPAAKRKKSRRDASAAGAGAEQGGWTVGSCFISISEGQ